MGSCHTCTSPQEGPKAADRADSGQIRRSVETPAASFRYPRRVRITRSAELERVAREGKRIRTRFIEVRVASPLGRQTDTRAGVRVGLVVARHGHTVVARNQLKRRLRELTRLLLLGMDITVDIVLRTHATAYDATFDVLQREVREIAGQLEGWQAPEENGTEAKRSVKSVPQASAE